jgi:hypothetical protein
MSTTNEPLLVSPSRLAERFRPRIGADVSASTISFRVAQPSGGLDFTTLDGLRAWRDFVIEHERECDGSGGCPIGSLGSQLAETDPEARAHVADGFRRWQASIQGGLREMHARGKLTPETNPARSPSRCWPPYRAAYCSPRSNETQNHSRPRPTHARTGRPTRRQLARRYSRYGVWPSEPTRPPFAVARRHDRVGRKAGARRSREPATACAHTQAPTE